jgi:hypothetical protein
VGLVVHVFQAVLVVHSAKAGLVVHLVQVVFVVHSAQLGLVVHVNLHWLNVPPKQPELHE